ncbi:MAG: GTPase ObgE [Bacillota bacterium]|jgi:GTP-binding protein|nr:GTPase ObgE [Bacillota bacterium]NLL26396.1 GTPase ObgE [Erysipelotrichia bacterium]
MKFIDSAKLRVKAGKGGDGIVAFRREAHVPLGGPFGGDGGKGGSIIFEVDTHKTTLLDFKFMKLLTAENGGNGKSKKMFGADGKDRIVAVPLGTIVRNLETGKIIADLTNVGQREIICKGGLGGRGNFSFKSSRNPAPDFAEKGEEGEEFDIEVELKLLADVGLVGFPSVGKSTILSVVSSAKPEIADYPFTTLSPKLGVVNVGDGRSFVMADLPGLIEGASQGRGLGHEFLKHIERCRVIIHVIDMGKMTGRDVVKDYETINNELETYKYKLMQRPQIVVANKMDEEGAQKNLAKLKAAYPDIEIFETISLINEGLQPVLYRAADLLDITDPFPLQDDEDSEEFGVVYRFEPEPEPFIIKNLGNGKWAVEGDRVRKLFRRFNFENPDEVMRFAVSLKKMGVNDALKERGAQKNDEVFIEDYVFEITEFI